MLKHGLRQHPLHATWCRMKNRCYNEKTPRYSDWGGRGIGICDEWRNNFKAFYDWAIMKGWGKGLEIDRIDNDGNYCPENCRFVSRKENCNNRRSNRIIIYENTKYTLASLSEKYNVSQQLLKDRLNRGWAVSRAIAAPLIKKQFELQNLQHGIKYSFGLVG